MQAGALIYTTNISIHHLFARSILNLSTDFVKTFFTYTHTHNCLVACLEMERAQSNVKDTQRPSMRCVFIFLLPTTCYHDIDKPQTILAINIQGKLGFLTIHISHIPVK